MEEFNKVTPDLSKIKKENPFRAPDNYFDDFSARFQMKLEAEKAVLPNPKNRIIQFLKPALGLAASFALIFMLVYWPLKSFMPNQSVSDNSVNYELNDNDYLTLLEGIDDNSFYALLEEPTTTTEFSDDDLIDYISANLSEYEIYLRTDF